MGPAAWDRLPIFGDNTLVQIAGGDPLFANIIAVTTPIRQVGRRIGVQRIFRDTLGRVDSSDVFQGMK